MNFTKEQEALIRQIGWEVGECVAQRIATDRAKDLALHAATCATKVKLDRLVWMTAGAGIFGGLSGGGIMALIRYLI